MDPTAYTIDVVEYSRVVDGEIRTVRRHKRRPRRWFRRPKRSPFGGF